MREMRRYRRAVLLPAIVWLAVQLAMASGFAFAVPSKAGADGQAVWMCTSFGVRLIDVESGEEADSSGAATGSGCQWCQAFGQVAAPDAPETPAPRFLLPANGPKVAFQPSERALGLRISAFRSRAPPSIRPA